MGNATRVLVADDDADSRAITRTILEFQGRQVLEAADGRECVIAAVVHRPDVIVLDLVMPGMDGWQAAAALRAEPATRSIPILALTASSHADDRTRALAAGCDRVLVKPTSLAELTAVIDALHQVAQTDARARAERIAPGAA